LKALLPSPHVLCYAVHGGGTLGGWGGDQEAVWHAAREGCAAVVQRGAGGASRGTHGLDQRLLHLLTAALRT